MVVVSDGTEETVRAVVESRPRRGVGKGAEAQQVLSMQDLSKPVAVNVAEVNPYRPPKGYLPSAVDERPVELKLDGWRILRCTAFWTLIATVAGGRSFLIAYRLLENPLRVPAMVWAVLCLIVAIVTIDLWRVRPWLAVQTKYRKIRLVYGLLAVGLGPQGTAFCGMISISLVGAVAGPKGGIFQLSAPAIFATTLMAGVLLNCVVGIAAVVLYRLYHAWRGVGHDESPWHVPEEMPGGATSTPT